MAAVNMPLPPWGSLDSGEDGTSMGWVTDWTAQAACRTTDPDELFVQGAAQNRAKAVCTGCPVRTECLADALDNRVEFGVWGGMTERERRALLRRRPMVTSWRRLLETARLEYERISGTGTVVDVDIDAAAAADEQKLAKVG
jgi:WhiB family redox-sensing transcriptional regulator